MGAMKRVKEAQAAKNGKGSTGGRGNGILSRLNHTDGKGREGKADWSDVPDGIVSWLVRTATEEGGACMFGTTRDGGALTLKIYDGDAQHTEYFGAQEDMAMAVWSFCLKLSPNEESNPESPQ